MAKKKILVKDILATMEDDEKVVITFFAYGIWYANSWNDNMRTVRDCKENLRYDCIVAQVGRITVKDGILNMGAEIVH